MHGNSGDDDIILRDSLFSLPLFLKSFWPRDDAIDSPDIMVHGDTEKGLYNE